MTSLICQECNTENTPEAKFCNQCGASLERKDDRFKTAVAILIALVSLAGAVLAWRISTIEGNAADADVSGIVSRISWQQARAASENDVYSDSRVYLQVRIHDLLSRDLVAEAEELPYDSPDRDRMWDEGWTETYVAEEYLDQITILSDYIRPDGSYDGQAAQDIDMAERSLTNDFDPAGRHFAEADRMRIKTLWLTGLALFLSLSLVFYTLAEVIVHPVKYLCVIAGSLIFVLFFVIWPIIEWLL